MQVDRSQRIGFVGLGNIGKPMAQALLGDGWSVDVHDVDEEVTQEVAGLGGRAVESPDRLAECTLVAVAVPDDDAVEQVLVGSGLLGKLPEDAVVLVHSTILPSTAQRLADLATSHGVTVLDAPVSGGASRAASGELTIMVGGDEAGLERARPVLSTLAADVIHTGGPGTGAAVKLANQLVMLASLAGALEGLRFAEAYGASPEVALEVMKTSTGDTWVTRNWGFFDALARSYDQSGVPVRYRPWSKDLWDLVHASRQADLTLPVSGLLAQLMPDMVERHAREDAS